RAIGVEITRANAEEYSVPQMKGRAPKSPATGSQVVPFQKLNPNLAMESRDCRQSTQAMPATMTTTRRAKKPVPRRKNRSSALRRRDGLWDIEQPAAEGYSLIFPTAFISRPTTFCGTGA